MTAEELIRQILRENRKISKIEILERLAHERKRSGGLISDETLLRMIARQFGIEVRGKDVLDLVASFSDLISGLNNVTVVGRILATFPPKEFRGRKAGSFASLLTADQSAMLRVILWNDKTKLVESGEIEAGKLARFVGGYTREDRYGKVELHIGEKSTVELNPKDIGEKNYPTLRAFATNIEKLRDEHSRNKIIFVGTVKRVFPVVAFQRQDGSDGKVMRLILTDETGEVAVVVWNEKVDELVPAVKEGDELQMVNARARNGINGETEIHVDSATYIGVSVSREFTKIADLKLGQRGISVKGSVATVPMTRDVTTSRGEVVKVAVFELSDNDGRIWVSAWRKHAVAVANLKKGDKLTIRRATVKKGFSDQPEISTVDASDIIILA